MNRYAFLSAALCGALFAPPAAAPAQAAGTSIQRCESADGSVAYTDKGCAVFGRDTVAVQSRMVGYPEDPAAAASGDDTAGAYPLATSLATRAPGRRSSAAGCARTPTQLQMDLRGAFALGDVNRIAESYHWVGVSSEQARGTMDRLQQLAGDPVLDARYYDATFAAGSGSFADGAQLLASAGGADGRAGMLQLMLAGDGASVVDFDVRRYKDCYFVSF